MDLDNYTTPAQVRSVLGVSDDELDDATVKLEVYTSGLGEDLREVSETLDSVYAAINGNDEATRTPAEARVWRMTRLFSTYSMAKRVGGSLSMFGPKSLVEGKASMTRFSGDPYKATLANIAEEFDLARQRLLDALAGLQSGTIKVKLRPLMAAVNLATDPVIG